MYERILDNNGDVMRVIPFVIGERYDLWRIRNRFMRIADGTIKSKRNSFVRALRKLSCFCDNHSLTMVFHNNDGDAESCSSRNNTPWFSDMKSLYDTRWRYTSAWYEEESERFAKLLQNSLDYKGDCYIRKVKRINRGTDL